MRVTYVLGISLALAFLVESLPGENFVEDEEFKNDPRHHTKRVNNLRQLLSFFLFSL